MNTTQRILIVTDLSQRACRVLADTVRDARRRAAALHILHVVVRPWDQDEGLLSFTEMEDLHTTMATALAGCLGTDAEAPGVRYAVRRGRSVQAEARAYARDYHLDEIIVCSEEAAEAVPMLTYRPKERAGGPREGIRPASVPAPIANAVSR